MQYFDASGRPDPNGAYQLCDGKMMLRPGRSATFDLTLCDAKAQPPKTIDEALKQRFAELAKGQGADVATVLANMSQSQLEDLAADVAKAFINSVAGAAVAAKFTDAQRASITASATSIASSLRASALPKAKPEEAMTTTLSDAAIRTDVERQRMHHDLAFAYMGDRAPPFDKDGALSRARQTARGRPAPTTATVSDTEIAAAYGGMVADVKKASLARAARVANAHRRQG